MLYISGTWFIVSFGNFFFFFGEGILYLTPCVCLFLLSSILILDYQQAQFRKYSRLIKEIKPEMEEYQQSTAAWGLSPFLMLHPDTQLYLNYKRLKPWR